MPLTTLVLDAMPDPFRSYSAHEVKDHVRTRIPDATITDVMRALLVLSGQGRIRTHDQGAARVYSRRNYNVEGDPWK